jgi:hypothetical protein
MKNNFTHYYIELQNGKTQNTKTVEGKIRRNKKCKKLKQKGR